MLGPRVTSGRDRTAALVVDLDDGRRPCSLSRYVERPRSLGYALTVFRAQGITVDHAFVLGDDSLFQEAAYTQLSRGRLSNSLYVTAPENPRWEIGHHAEDERRDALEGLVEALARSREQTMARDRLPQWPTPSTGDPAATYARYAELGRWLTDHAPPDVTDELAAASTRADRLRTSGRDFATALAEARRLAAAQRARNDWVTRYEAEITACSRLEGELRRHEYRLGQAAGFAWPEHLTTLLGPLPQSITATERWQSAAGAVEAYRACWNITGTESVGPEPTNPEQRAQWHKIVAVLGAAGFLAPDASRESGPERSSLAAEWARIRAVDRQRERDD